MLWCYIKHNCLTKLIKINSSLNSGKYIQLLKDNLIVDLETFQHKGTPCHISYARQQIIADNEGDTVLKKQSAQRPDLNIIKQIWQFNKHSLDLAQCQK